MRKRIICLTAALIFMLSGCNAKSNDTVIATVGEEQITMSEFEFYLTSVKQQMQGTELSNDEDWQTKEINGKKAIEVAKEQALNAAARNIAYMLIYEKMGNTITDEDMESIKQYKNNLVQQYEKNGGYDEFLKSAGIQDSFIDMLCKSMFCSDKLYSEFSAGRQVSDDEADKYYDEHYDEYYASYRHAKHVLILTQDSETNTPYSDDKKAEAKKKADEILDRAKKGENFDKLVSEYSEDPGSQSSPDGYTFTDGEMVQEFQDCVDSLKPGEIGFTETSYGYHIIKRLEVDKGYFRESIKSRILSGEFGEYIDQKMEEYGITVEEKEEINQALEAKKE